MIRVKSEEGHYLFLKQLQKYVALAFNTRNLEPSFWIFEGSHLFQIILQENPSAVVGHVNVIGPALAECLKDGSTPVRLAAERCALHIFQLTKGNFFCFWLFFISDLAVYLTSQNGDWMDNTL